MHPEVPCHFFWDKKEAPEQLVIDKSLFFHQLNDTSFLNYMAGAKAYATTAGFESVCEAMYLCKPVLMVPTHVEQSCNAYDAMQSGAGVVSDTFNLDTLLTLAENHEPNTKFRQWAKQSGWLIAREFRADLLMDERPVTAFHRITTNWVYRIGHRLSL